MSGGTGLCYVQTNMFIVINGRIGNGYISLAIFDDVTRHGHRGSRYRFSVKSRPMYRFSVKLPFLPDPANLSEIKIEQTNTLENDEKFGEHFYH